MRKEITIGEETVEMVANAATPFVFLKIFKDDLLKGMQKDPDDFLRYERLAFVMAKQADTPTAELLSGKITEEDFIAWLSEYEAMDMVDAANEAVSLYLSSKKGQSVPKTPAD